MLFVGEAPPASGRYFYRADSMMFEATRDAFEGSCGPMPAGSAFLERFADAGCWLWDLNPAPTDLLPEAKRLVVASRGEAALADQLVSLQPVHVVAVLERIETNVRNAMAQAHSDATLTVLPFPRRGPGRVSRAYLSFVGGLGKLLQGVVEPAAEG
jgi:hypothetical protein